MQDRENFSFPQSTILNWYLNNKKKMYVIPDGSTFFIHSEI